MLNYCIFLILFFPSSFSVLVNTPNLQPSSIPTLPPNANVAANSAVNTNTNKQSHIHDNQQGAISPLTLSQVVFLNTVTNVQQPRVSENRNIYGLPGHQTPRLTSQILRELDWTQIDRRAEDGWWHLYPFGERYFDRELARRPWMDKQIDLDFFLPYYGFRFNYTFVSFVFKEIKH